MKIDEVSRQTGLTKDMIRFYEKKGIIQISRDENGYRNFSQNDLYNLLTIRQYNIAGMRLSTIRELLQSDNFHNAHKELEEQIQKLEEEALWLKLRQENAKDISDLLTDVETNVQIKELPVHSYFYYQKHGDEKAYFELINRINTFHFTMRIQKENLLSPSDYPDDIGILTKQLIPGTPLKPIIYPNVKVVRVYYQNTHQHLLEKSDMENILTLVNEKGITVSDCFTTQYFGDSSKRKCIIVCDFIQV